MSQPQLEGRRPVNKLRIAAFITAGLVGIANYLTLTGVIPVETGTQICTSATILVPILLGLASTVKKGETPLFDEAAQPGSGATSAKHNNITGVTTVSYGGFTDVDEIRMKKLEKKLK